MNIIHSLFSTSYVSSFHFLSKDMAFVVIPSRHKSKLVQCYSCSVLMSTLNKFNAIIICHALSVSIIYIGINVLYYNHLSETQF